MPQIKIGQIWEDKDLRRNRTVKVCHISSYYVHCRSQTSFIKTMVSIDRFLKRFSLVKEVEGVRKRS